MIQKIAELIRSNSTFLVVSHVRPDGDSLGSQLALALILRSLGKNVDMLSRDSIPSRYSELPGVEQIAISTRVRGAYDVTFVLECSNIDRPGIAGLNEGFVVNIDHHHSTEPFGNVSWIDPAACAVGQMIYRLMKTLGVPLTRDIATNIYVAIVTDTGSFQFSSTTADTFRIAAELADHGANAPEIAMKVFHSNPLEKVRSMGKILNAMELDPSGKIVSTVLGQDDWRSADGAEDLEGLVNYPLTIEGIDVSVFLRELPDGSYRVSMRSKSDLDVSRIAARFGGGGHRKAAGCQMIGSLDRVRKQLIASIQSEMNTPCPLPPSR
jgi:phosphoesterase RecJ-like protein